MIEIVPHNVHSALMYFHSAHENGSQIAPFLPLLQKELPDTYIWAGDGCIDGNRDPVMGKAVSYGFSDQRYWFVFPMQDSWENDFAAAVEPMGAVLTTCGGYVNALADQVMARFNISASRVVLCGLQHGACVALAAAMMRRADPFKLAVLFDPWPWEAYYFQSEHDLPATRVVCIDNPGIRERERLKGVELPVYRLLKGYGILAEGITVETGDSAPDAFMIREAIQQILKTLLG